MPVSTTSKVYISHEVYHVCTSHAMMTEREEVMGLLLGDSKAIEGRTDIFIWASMTLPRADKRPDRCEIQPEQLVQGLEFAEQISAQIGHTTRTVGWYHSHPHITCLPSHVDLRTQHQYQAMDGHFVGLIFTVFNQSADGVVRQEVMGFRAREVTRNGSTEFVYEALEVRVVPIHALLPKEAEELSRAMPKFGGSLGHNAIIEAKEQLFKEIKERYEEEKKALQDPPESPGLHSLARLDLNARFQSQLISFLSDVIVPLRQQMDDAAFNAKRLAQMHRRRAEEAAKWGHRPAKPAAPGQSAAAASSAPAKTEASMVDNSENEDMARSRQQHEDALRDSDRAEEEDISLEDDEGLGGFIREDHVGFPVPDTRRVTITSTALRDTSPAVKRRRVTEERDIEETQKEDDSGDMDCVPCDQEFQRRRVSTSSASSIGPARQENVKDALLRSPAPGTPGRFSTGLASNVPDQWSKASASDEIMDQACPGYGLLRYVEGRWYEARPDPDKDRIAGHPDTLKSKAKNRKFDVWQDVSADQAETMAQQYLYGGRYEDVLREAGFEEYKMENNKTQLRRLGQRR